MFFSDTRFLFFFAAVLLALRLTRLHARWVVLLLSSLAFYATFRTPALLLFLGAISTVAWLTARFVDRARDDRVRWRWAAGGVVNLLALLAGARLLGPGGPWTDWVPSYARWSATIGVSYYSLQAISYVVDVYLGRMGAERNLAKVMTYLALFPKLIQGPLERAPILIPQLQVLQTPGYDKLRSAAVLFGVGLFKKVVLADRLGQLVNPIYAEPRLFGGIVPVLAVYAYAFQLYFDFSGYTDMARAVARIMGIELSENFNAPYLSTSISDFWRRWHMSFSRWLLDYVFTPLQLVWRRHPRIGTAGALFVTFALSGIWHGAAWTYAVWGLLHGFYLAFESLWKGRKNRKNAGTRWSKIGGTLLTFHLVAFAWIFFRAPSLNIAGSLLAAVARPTIGLGRLVAQVGGRSVAVTLGAGLLYWLWAVVKDRPAVRQGAQLPALRWAAYLCLFVAILLLRQDASSYIYSQF